MEEIVKFGAQWGLPGVALLGTFGVIFYFLKFTIPERDRTFREEMAAERAQHDKHITMLLGSMGTLRDAVAECDAADGVEKLDAYAHEMTHDFKEMFHSVLLKLELLLNGRRRQGEQ